MSAAAQIQLRCRTPWRGCAGSGSVATAAVGAELSVEGGIFLEIVGPIRYSYGIAGLLGGFDCILIDRRVNQPEIIDDLGGLGALASPQESRNGDGGEEGNDRHHNHDFHEGKAPA